jgi:hypothetical protein
MVVAATLSVAELEELPESSRPLGVSVGEGDAERGLDSLSELHR